MPAATLPRILKYGKVATPRHRDSGDGDIFALIGIAAGAMLDAGGQLLRSQIMKALRSAPTVMKPRLRSGRLPFIEARSRYTPPSN